MVVAGCPCLLAESEVRAGLWWGWLIVARVPDRRIAGRGFGRACRAVASWITPVRLLLIGATVAVGSAIPVVATATADQRWVMLPAGELVVGMVLEAGRVPPGLRSGARVGVLDTGDGERRGRPLVAEAGVVSATMEMDVTRVAVKVPSDLASAVATAAARDRIALVTLPASDSRVMG